MNDDPLPRGTIEFFGRISTAADAG